MDSDKEVGVKGAEVVVDVEAAWLEELVAVEATWLEELVAVEATWLEELVDGATFVEEAAVGKVVTGSGAGVKSGE